MRRRLWQYALWRAVFSYRDNGDIIEFLLERGADQNYDNQSHISALTKQVEATAAGLNSSGVNPATVVGAELNGQTAIGTSGAPPAVIAPQLEVAAGELGGVGARSASGPTVGCCGEFHSANDLLLKNPNAAPSDINFTPAIRPRTGQAVPTCANCATMFKKKN